MLTELESTNKFYINNNYIILEKKGEGAYGSVYLVEEKETKKKYAIKFLNENDSSFENEKSILEKVSKLNNKYIINLIECGECPIKINPNEKETNKKYLILDYASNGELFDLIFKTEKGLKEKYAKLIFGKILRGVQALHKAGICHRDLKMENILVDDFFNPKICDFGFATEIKGKDGSGKLYKVLGTETYKAPEIHRHLPYNGIKVDIFSLGVILLNITTFKNGFITATINDPFYIYIAKGHFNKYWQIITKEIGEISEELKDLYIKMVSFNPKKRPNIDEILKHPWMKEIEDLNEEEYKILENEIYNEFEKLKNNIT